MPIFFLQTITKDESLSIPPINALNMTVITLNDFVIPWKYAL
jgi:hypothetical protein